jgi:glyoxylase-like metal-dependent hydrolase (beta-lactamase superfamily II)
VATPIPFVRDLEPRYGEAEEVSPLVRRVLARNPHPFTYLGTGTYLIGHGEVAVVDPGPDDAGHVDAILRALEPGERITHLLITHTHSDHSPATAALQERTGAPSHGFGPHGTPDEPLPARFTFGDPEADGTDRPPRGDDEPKEGADHAFSPDVTLRAGDVVAGEGWTLEAVHTPGHASNHLCYALAEERLLCTGDHVMGWSTSVIGPPDGDLGAYLASLELLLARDDAWYLPTHGPAVHEPRPLVEAFLAHRRERSEQVLAVLQGGPATIVEIVPRLYADVSKKLWQGAGASIWAHVLALAAEGALEPVDGPLTRASRLRLA